MSQSLKNISLNDFRKFLEYKGLKVIHTTGGHEVWSCKSLLRPIIIQTHVDPVPEFIIRSNLRTLECDKSEFNDFLNPKKTKKKT